MRQETPAKELPEFTAVARSHEVPVAVLVAAGCAIVCVLIAVPIGHDRKVPAQTIAPPIFAVGDDVSVVAAVMPFVALADAAIEPLAICAIGVRTIVAIDVASNGVASQAAQDNSPDDAKATPMGDRTADHAAGDGS